MEKVAVIGIKNEEKANVCTLDIIGFLQNVDAVFLYNYELVRPINKPVTEKYINAIKPNMNVYYAEDFFSYDDINNGTKDLYSFLILPENKDILRRVVRNIPKQYRPDIEEIPTYDSLKYELQFILICLTIDKSLQLVDRYGERLKKILELLFCRFNLSNDAKIVLLEDKIIESYHATKPLSLPITPLPYRLICVSDFNSALDSMKKYNQVPVIQGPDFDKLLSYGLSNNRERFVSYLEKNCDLDLHGLQDQKILNLVSKKIVLPLLKSYSEL